jgi:hypothetical protein
MSKNWTTLEKGPCGRPKPENVCSYILTNPTKPGVYGIIDHCTNKQLSHAGYTFIDSFDGNVNNAPYFKNCENETISWCAPGLANQAYQRKWAVDDLTLAQCCTRAIYNNAKYVGEPSLNNCHPDYSGSTACTKTHPGQKCKEKMATLCTSGYDPMFGPNCFEWCKTNNTPECDAFIKEYCAKNPDACADWCKSAIWTDARCIDLCNSTPETCPFLSELCLTKNPVDDKADMRVCGCNMPDAVYDTFMTDLRQRATISDDVDGRGCFPLCIDSDLPTPTCQDPDIAKCLTVDIDRTGKITNLIIADKERCQKFFKTCPERPCPPGETCMPNKTCCARPCAGVCCRDSETCVDGHCCKTPDCGVGAPCEQDTDCDGLRCADGKCCKNVCGNKCCKDDEQCNYSPYGSSCCRKDKICLNKCCKDGETCVNSMCCPVDRACSDKCCDAGELCVSGNCCKPDQVCGDKCCKAGDVCKAGKCCESGKVCGAECCGENETCTRDRCCKTSKACGDGCCKEEETCVDGVCCKAEEMCEDGKCCKDGKCIDGKCCDSENQCEGGCCDGENMCVNDVCCKKSDVCVDDKQCCKPPDKCISGRCCPAERICGDQCCSGLKGAGVVVGAVAGVVFLFIMWKIFLKTRK